MRTFARFATISTALLLMTVGQGNAQVPQRITATYDDWTVSCVTATEPKEHKSCEMVEMLTLSGQQNPGGQITIGRPSENQPLKIFIQVPPNVSLQPGIKLLSDKKQPGLMATFSWCIPARCLADADLNDAAIKNMLAKTEPGLLEYKDASQHDVALSVSFKGFAPAFDWMAKQ